MTNINTAAKREQIELIVVGRGEKIRLCSKCVSNPSKKVVNEIIDVPKGTTLRQTLMEVIAEEITKASEGFSAAGKKMTMEIYTVGQVALKYYQMVPYLKGGHFMTTDEIMALSMKKDGTMNRDTDADRGAYDDMAQALAKAFKAGHAVHMQASGLASFFDLIIPTGVVVEEGQILNFNNGVSAEGIRVRGWNKCNRKGVQVVVKGTDTLRAYISKAADPNKPWRGLKNLLDRIDNCWNDLPDDRDDTKDDGTREDLYA